MYSIPLPITVGFAIVAGIMSISVLTYYSEIDKIDFITDADVLPEIKQACEEKGISDISVCAEWQRHKEMRNTYLMEDVYHNTRIALGDIFGRFIMIASVPIGAFVIYSGIRLRGSGYSTEVYGIVILAGIVACTLPLIWYGLGMLFSS